MVTNGSIGTRNEDGQVAVVMAVVLALIAVAVIGLTLIGQAAINRTRAASAADAVALAAAQGDAGGRELAQWYRGHGVEVTIVGATTGQIQASTRIEGDTATPARATSFAEVRSGAIALSPALAAVVARAEQLLGVRLAAEYPAAHSVVVAPEHQDLLSSVSEPLRLCQHVSATGASVFSICN